MSSKKSKQRKGGKPSVSEQQKIQDRIDKRKFIRKVWFSFFIQCNSTPQGLEFSTTENCKLCRSSGTLAVACDSCSTFYHLTCVNITEDELVDSGTWICPVCVVCRLFIECFT